MKKLRITIGNKSYDVTVEDLTDADNYRTPAPQPVASSAAPAPVPTPAPPSSPQPQLPVDTGAVTSPMAGAIKSILVEVGDRVDAGQPLLILDAMKMEDQITAPLAGAVKAVEVSEGDSVQEGHVLLVLE